MSEKAETAPPTTYQECVTLSATALDQAEKLVNRVNPDIALVSAVARIGQGWAVLARTMFETECRAPVELTSFDPEIELPRFAAQLRTPTVEAAPQGHVHTHECQHAYVQPLEQCRTCHQGPYGHVTPRCNAVCPLPGASEYRMPGKTV